MQWTPVNDFGNLRTRRLLGDVIKWLDTQHIILIKGARQVGKTSLMRLIAKKLMDEGVPVRRIHFYDLEDELLRISFDSSYREVVRFLRDDGVDGSERHFVFLDEIQYLKDPSPVLKLIHDHHPNIKLIVSSSSSLAIERKWTQSLAGRFVDFVLYPLDFQEYLEFKGVSLKRPSLSFDELLNEAVHTFEVSPTHFELLRNLWHEYVIWGGLPAVALQSDPYMRKRLLHSYTSAYVLKDVAALGLVQKRVRFLKVLNLLAARSSNLLNLNELSKISGVPRSTLGNYLTILETSFIIELIKPFKRNPSTEIVKMPKVYLFDNGVKNGLLGTFSPLDGHPLSGQLVENAVLLNLRAKGWTVKYWRAKSGAEVDFVLQLEDRLVAVEVKQGTFCPPSIPRGLRSFMRAYRPDISIIFNDRCLQCIPESRLCYLPHWAVGWIGK